MSKTLYLYILLLFCQNVIAQKNDYVWPGGENINNPQITGGFLIDFNSLTPVVSTRNRPTNLFQSSAAISDTNGQLVAYTNGCAIYSGADDTVLPNGNNINPGSVHNSYCPSNSGFGYYPNTSQSSMFLPLPGSNNRYYLFHKQVKLVFNPFDGFTETLYYSIVEKNESDSAWVVAKNVPLMKDTLASGMITAVKHANGRDWWIVTPRNREDQIYTFLFTPEGIVDTTLQYIGFNLEQDGSCQVSFSPDGSRFIACSPYTGLGLFDFDRATGVLSNYQSIDIKPHIWQWTDFTGCAVSPNNRFVYVSSTLDVLQYDLQAPDIAASVVNVGHYDGGENPLATTFAQAQLAPDCKIYLQTGQQAKNLHVIHSPNEPGMACNFEQRAVVLPRANRGSLSYFPHFRLGPLDNPGEPCTTVVSTTAPPTLLPVFSVFPNPATTELRILANRAYGDAAQFRLYTGAGTLVREMPFEPSGDTPLRVPVSDLPPGIYYYQVWCAGGLVRADKVVMVGQ
jgi:hypothetical protein